jgi:hypothetical protein
MATSVVCRCPKDHHRAGAARFDGERYIAQDMNNIVPGLKFLA